MMHKNRQLFARTLFKCIDLYVQYKITSLEYKVNVQRISDGNFSMKCTQKTEYHA